MHNKLCFLSVLTILTATSITAYAEPAKPNYILEESLPFSGSVRWDYLTFDASNHRLFITRGDSVDVLDTDSKKIIASIPNLDGVHGVALAPELNKGFISEGKANHVTTFDLTTYKPTGTIPTGKKPDAVIYDPSTGKLFVADGDDNKLTVINAKTNAVLGSVALGGAPEFAVLDGKGKLYINLEDKSQIAVVDIKTMKVITHYNLSPACEEPAGLAIDRKNNRLFSACANKAMVVVQAATGKIIDTLPIGAHSDAAVFDPETGLAFSSNGNDGTLTVIAPKDTDHYEVVQNADTGISARTMALDPTTHRLYLSAGEPDGFENNAKGEPRLKIKPDTFRVLIMALTE